MGIVIKDLKYSFPKASTLTLNIPELTVGDGEKIALVGRSGSGKSTLLHAIAGIIKISIGSLKVNDVELTTLSETERDAFRANSIGYVFQTFNLIQSLTAIENVMLAMSLGNKTINMKSHAKSLLDRVGLGKKLYSKPSALSVGEQQRVAIARAIANKPVIILADEPTANLDEQNTETVLNLLNEISSDENQILMLVTHERDVAERFSRRIDLKTINIA